MKFKIGDEVLVTDPNTSDIGLCKVVNTVGSYRYEVKVLKVLTNPSATPRRSTIEIHDYDMRYPEPEDLI